MKHNSTKLVCAALMAAPMVALACVIQDSQRQEHPLVAKHIRTQLLELVGAGGEIVGHMKATDSGATLALGGRKSGGGVITLPSVTLDVNTVPGIESATLRLLGTDRVSSSDQTGGPLIEARIFGNDYILQVASDKNTFIKIGKSGATGLTIELHNNGDITRWPGK